MNLDQLSSATSIPTLSFVLWGLGLLVAVGVSTWQVKASAPVGVLIGISIGGIIATSGLYVMSDAWDTAKNVSFHAEVEKSYDLKTDATLQQITEAAHGSKTVLLKNDDEVLEVRPSINGDILTFLLTADGKPVEPTKG